MKRVFRQLWIGGIVAVLFMALLVSLLPEPMPVRAKGNPGDYVPGRLIVKFRSHKGMLTAVQTWMEADAAVIDEIPQLDTLVIRTDEVNFERALRRFQARADVEYVEPDYIGYPTWTPNDPSYTGGQQWALGKIQMPLAWDLARGQGAVIAVLDTGVDVNHPELQGRLLPGFSFTDDTTNVADNCGHGTHVTGIIAANTNNGVGIAGVAPEAQILPVKVMERYQAGVSCYGSYSDFAAGLVYAADHGARVVNMSFGGTTNSTTLANAIAYAANRGVLLVGAAGNNNSSTLFYPAAYTQVIAVAGTDGADARYASSNYGDWVDIAAPAVGVYSLYSNSSYTYMSGTSMAAPHVAGVAGLLLSQNPAYTAADLRALLQNNADDLGAPGFDPYFGWGRLNAYRALTNSSAAPTPAPTNTPTPVPTNTPTPTPEPPTPTPAPPTPTPTLEPPTPTPTPIPTPPPVIADRLETGRAKRAVEQAFIPSSTFQRGEKVAILTRIVQGGAVVAGATVQLTVYDPGGRMAALRAVTDATGIAIAQYQLARTAYQGTYEVRLSNVTVSGATFDPQNSVGPVTFTVN